MKAFAYARPTSLAQALSLLSPTARPKGGGYDLLDLAKRGVSTPETLVQLSRLPGLARIAELRSNLGSLSLHVGAAATLADVAANEAVRRLCPVLADAAQSAATPQVRNVATVAGNLLQRPRCAYFRDAFFDCRKRGGSTCPAREGIHDEMAIFGNAVCCATHPSNLAAAFLALNAVLLVEGPTKTGVEESKRLPRLARIEEVFVTPEEDPLREARVAANELVSEVIVNAEPVSAYVEVNQKQSYDWASVACAVVLGVEGGKIRDARVALGAVAPVPILSKGAADALRGKSVKDEAAWAAAGDAAVVGATPLPRNGHKVRQLRACVRRAVAAAAARST